MKIFGILVFLVPFFGLNSCVDFECKYAYEPYSIIGRVYACKVQNNACISPNNIQISSITGTHMSGYNNDNVEAFDPIDKILLYFPQGLEKHFKNLRALIFYGTGLKEIHQSDLKPFPKLELLRLGMNNIEVLEEGLFDFNPELKSVGFNTNKVKRIHPYVFDNLSKLVTLDLSNNQCINRAAWNAPNSVKDIIRRVKIVCLSPDINSPTAAPVTAEPKLEEFKNELKTAMDIFGKELKQEMLAMRQEMKEELMNFRQELMEDIKKDIVEKFVSIISACKSSEIANYTQNV